MWAPLYKWFDTINPLIGWGFALKQVTFLESQLLSHETLSNAHETLIKLKRTL